MRKVPNTMWALLVSVLLVAASACTTGSVGTGNAGNAGKTNANAGANAKAASGSEVTLAVLDGLFTSDEAFAGELKSKLQLTDEQIERLKQVAREERESLQESEGDEHKGSTTEATERAAEKIRNVIGTEKTEQLMAFARERWEGGPPTAAATPAKPNSVPTDTRIVVNIPAYRMDAFENGQLVKSYKVGIGYPEFPLPTGLRNADTIIFNPTWTPPDEPWVKGKFKPGQRVEAGSPNNPLGVIKIPIGLPSLIHGGKSAAKIGTFASHGCVGLTNQQVQDFATVIAKLGGLEITKEQVLANARTRGRTNNVKLSNVVPVELRYETIVVEDGKLYIYRDVYDRGTNTEEKLRAVLAAHGVSFDSLSEEERTQVLDALQQMARDATGKPATGAGATPTPTPRRRSAYETKTIKGQKEIVIEIAALAGKGYPAAANLDTGGAPQPKKPAAKPAQAARAGGNQ